VIQDFLHARFYLAPAPDSFWEWRDGGQVITWRDGGTIAFRTEILEVLGRLAPHGFPDFDAVVLFLAACRATGMIGAAEIEKHNVLPSLSASEKDNWRYRDLLVALEAISAISHSLRTTLDGKTELAVMLFETAYVVESGERAAGILRGLERGLPREMYGATRSREAKDILSRLAPLAAGAQRIAPVRLALRQKTGLEQLPQLAPVEAAPTESLRALIGRLEQDEELGGLARLTKNLLAALTLPRAVSEPQDLPLGGVSDISNRGSLDRLLVSELAHDDLTFTVRVALSEALYLRREAPPRIPPQRRIVLIDAGLRMWGLPRVFGTAAAMALAVSHDKKAETTVYRARGSHLDLVSFTTREGVVSHLAALEPEAHPGSALAVFHRLSQDDDNATEAVLVTCPEVLADKSFQRLLQETDLSLLYVVAVSRSGELRLTRRTPQGTKVLREVHCPLEEILAPRRNVTPLVNRDIDPLLPAILRIGPFPLRVPHPIDPQRLLGDAESGPLHITTDGRLLHWDHPGWGPRQLSDTLPKGKLHWHEPRTTQNTVTAVMGRLQQGQLYLLHAALDSGKCQTILLDLEHPNPRAVAAHAGALFVISAEHVEVFSIDNGQPLESFRTTNTWMRDRFFYGSEGAYALSFDGISAVFEKVCDFPTPQHQQQLIGLFDVLDVDGPACVTASGKILYAYELADEPERQKNDPFAPIVVSRPSSPAPRFPMPRGYGPFRLGAVSADGHRIVLSPRSNSNRREPSSLLELGERNPVEVWQDPEMAVAGKFLKGISNRTLRHRFASVFVDHQTRVLVAASHRTHCRIKPDSLNRRILLEPEKEKPGGKRIPFMPTLSPPGTSYRLSVAQWEDGSRAYLDSRGLLHLKSSDLQIPELTLVLTEGTTAGWCAKRGTFGPVYFTGDKAQADVVQAGQMFFLSVLQDFVERLR